jgi:hypothetical protein
MSAQKRARLDDTGGTFAESPAASGTGDFQPVRLSVGGTPFTTTRATLCAEKGSMLATKFEQDSPFGDLVTDDTGAIFLDTDPLTFNWILGYLRRGCHLAGSPAQPLLEQVRADADYFGLAGLVAALDKKLDVMTQPKHVYEHWALGPLDFGQCSDPAERQIRKDFVESEAGLNALGAKGFRLVHAAMDAEGKFMDCMMEKQIE